MDQADLKTMSMSKLIAHYNTLATAKGLPLQSEFKNLAAARAACMQIEGNKMTDETNPGATTEANSTDAPFEGVTDGSSVVGATATNLATGEASKYSTVGKRGPNQGIGEFAKSLLMAGVSTADTLAKVKEQFPTAKTSASCIAYYKAALKNPNLGKRKAAVDPAALRAKAAELMAAATAAEAAALAKTQADAAAAVAAAAAAQAAVEAANKAAAAQAEALATTDAGTVLADPNVG
jgi:hypothetical protein